MKREILGDLVISMENPEYTKRIWTEKITRPNGQYDLELRTAIEYKGKSHSLDEIEVPGKKH